MSSYNCDCSNGREHYTRALMQAGLPVDNYGRCLRNVRGQGRTGNKNAVLSQYLFTLAFENSNCPYWITEKLFDALSAGSVPVYMGAPNIRDYVPNASGVIFVDDFASPAALAQHLLRVSRDRSLYVQYHAWRAWPLSRGYLNMPVGSVPMAACDVASRVEWTS